MGEEREKFIDMLTGEEIDAPPYIAAMIARRRAEAVSPTPAAPAGSVAICDCGAELTMCSSCAVADYQAAHPDCRTCVPISGEAASGRGWLTVLPHEAPYQVDDAEAWYHEAVAQRAAREAAERERDEALERERRWQAGFEERLTAAESVIPGARAALAASTEREAGLREVAEESLAAHSTVFDFGRHTNVTWEDALSKRDELRARLAALTKGGE